MLRMAGVGVFLVSLVIASADTPGKESWHLKERQAEVAMQSQVLAVFNEASPLELHRLLETPTGYTSQILYVSVLLIAGAGITIVFKDRGFTTCVSIMCNVLALSVMSLLVKNIYQQNFQFPQFVTATHGMMTCFVGLAALGYRQKTTGEKITMPNAETWMKGILPVGIAFALSLGMANAGILYSNAHFYEMLGAASTVVTALVGIALGKPVHIKLWMPMGVITIGALILSSGETDFSVVATGLIVGAIFCRAMKAQIQNVLMSPSSGLTKLDPLELVVCTSMVIIVIMLVWSAATEGLKPWRLASSPGVILALFLAAVNASILNIASLFVIRSVGAVAQQCIGQLKSILCCFGAVAAFHEEITMQQIIGYTLTLGAIICYNQIDMAVKAEKEQEKREEAPIVSAKV